MNTIIAAGLFFVSIFAAGLTQTAPLYGSRSLETITFMPRERELQYPPLQGINNLTAETIQMEYTRVLECMQQVDSLSAEMVRTSDNSSS